MISRLADVLVPVAGRLTVTVEDGARFAPGSVVVANHTSLADPAVVLAALHRLGIEPVVMAAAGLWRIPLLGRALRREGHIPVHRGDRRALRAIDAGVEALNAGRTVLIYAEGGLPRRRDAGERAPGAFRGGLARLVEATGADLIPVGQAGARSLASGSAAKQLGGVLTAPVRRPCLHVHAGAPLTLTGDRAARTRRAREAVTAAWRIAAARLDRRDVADPAPACQAVAGVEVPVTGLTARRAVPDAVSTEPSRLPVES